MIKIEIIDPYVKTLEKIKEELQNNLKIVCSLISQYNESKTKIEHDSLKQRLLDYNELVDKLYKKYRYDLETKKTELPYLLFVQKIIEDMSNLKINKENVFYSQLVNKNKSHNNGVIRCARCNCVMDEKIINNNIIHISIDTIEKDRLDNLEIVCDGCFAKMSHDRNCYSIKNIIDLLHKLVEENINICSEISGLVTDTLFSGEKIDF